MRVFQLFFDGRSQYCAFQEKVPKLAAQHKEPGRSIIIRLVADRLP